MFSVKILKSPVYESRLAAFSVTFADHRKELEFTLTIHTTVGVDAANVALAELSKGMKAVNEKLDMIAVFRRLDTPQEKKLQKFVNENGGPEAVIANDQGMAALADLEKDEPVSGTKKQIKVDIMVVNKMRLEFREDFEGSLQKNMTVFARKLEMQAKQIVDDVEAIVRRESNLVIRAVISGPHDRIIDPVCLSCYWLSSYLTDFLGFASHMEGHGLLSPVISSLAQFLLLF